MLAGMLALQPGEEGLGFQSRLGLEFRFDLGPDLSKRIRPRAVGARLLALAGECARVAIVSGGLG